MLHERLGAVCPTEHRSETTLKVLLEGLPFGTGNSQLERSNRWLGYHHQSIVVRISQNRTRFLPGRPLGSKKAMGFHSEVRDDR